MKKKLVLLGFIGFTALFGCSQVSQDVEATVPTGFIQVSKDKLDSTSISILKIKDITTGCYYLVGSSDFGINRIPNITQMFIEKNGVSVPYCEK